MLKIHKLKCLVLVLTVLPMVAAAKSDSKKSTVASGDPVVKMSTANICYVKKCGAYAQIKDVKESFSSLSNCYGAGGKKPRDISEDKMWKCELDVLGFSSREKLAPEEPVVETDAHEVTDAVEDKAEDKNDDPVEDVEPEEKVD